MRIKLLWQSHSLAWPWPVAALPGRTWCGSMPNALRTPLCRYIVAAGAELDANVHDAGLRAELKAGETTHGRDQGGV